LCALQVLLWLVEGHYLIATGLAVEASVLFNFIWHRRWTWADRPRRHACAVLLRFNLTNGVVSLLSNIFLMYFFVGEMGLRPLPANIASIAICSIINFTLADRLVFV
jgi:putative flippase GtrA